MAAASTMPPRANFMRALKKLRSAGIGGTTLSGMAPHPTRHYGSEVATSVQRAERRLLATEYNDTTQRTERGQLAPSLQPASIPRSAPAQERAVLDGRHRRSRWVG